MTDIHPLQRALEATAAPPEVAARAQAALQSHAALCAETVVACVISEYQSGELGRVHTAVWFFTETLAAESSLINADEEDIDFAPLSDIDHVVTTAKSYNWAAASDASRLKVEFWFTDRRLGSISATGANCDLVADLLRTTLVPSVSR